MRLLRKEGIEQSTSTWRLLAMSSLIRLWFLLRGLLMSLRYQRVVEVRMSKAVATHKHTHPISKGRSSRIIRWVTLISGWGLSWGASILALCNKSLYIELVLRSSNLLRLYYSMLMLIDNDNAACLNLSDIFLLSLTRSLSLGHIRWWIKVLNYWQIIIATAARATKLSCLWNRL